MRQQNDRLDQIGWTVLGLLWGPAFGMLMSLIFTFDLALGLVYGAAFGVLAGSVIDILQSRRADKRRG